ncbi:MAG: glycosyltransferase, partial [Desulfovibrionaceae bacterium]|nr:glycosyltransferase [Desulfovibrionaceae bacterium]
NEGEAALILESLASPWINPRSGLSYLEKQEGDSLLEEEVEILVYLKGDLAEIEACLEQVILKRGQRQDKIWIIDDACEPLVVNFLQTLVLEHPLVEVVRQETHLGLAKSVNQLFQKLKANFFIVISSQTQVSDYWVEKILEAFKANSKTGLVGVLGPDSWIHSFALGLENYLSLDNKDQKLKLINKYCEMWSKADYYPYIPYPSSTCIGISTAAFKRIKGFAEDYLGLDGLEVQDLAYRMSIDGWGIALCTNTYVNALNLDFKGDLKAKALQKLIERYGKYRIERDKKTLRYHPQILELRKKLQLVLEANL